MLSLSFSEQMDYLPLEKVAAELLKKIQSLKSGEMASTELSGLVGSSRDVYERLVILEFQALEKKTAPVKELKPFKIDTEATENPAVSKEINIQEEVEEKKVLEKKKPVKIAIEEPAETETIVDEVVTTKEKETPKTKPDPVSIYTVASAKALSSFWEKMESILTMRSRPSTAQV